MDSHLFGKNVRAKWTLVTFNQRTIHFGLVTALKHGDISWLISSLSLALKVNLS